MISLTWALNKSLASLPRVSSLSVAPTSLALSIGRPNVLLNALVSPRHLHRRWGGREGVSWAGGSRQRRCRRLGLGGCQDGRGHMCGRFELTVGPLGNAEIDEGVELLENILHRCA